MSNEVRDEMFAWCNKGNPSASYATAVASRQMMDNFRSYIGSLSRITTIFKCDTDDVPEKIDPKNYAVLFTSGATESNCTILRACVESFEDMTGRTPHLVVSAIEHRSVMDLVESYVSRSRATVTYVAPTLSGHIRASDVARAITHDTCLVCVMHANNETGAINDVTAIGKVAHEHNVPFHCDAVQSYGKVPLHGMDVDSFCVSFHKMGGPPGVGCLVIKQQLLVGYKLQPCMYGSQNNHLRGGTENLPGIGASFLAIKTNMANRDAKNKHLLTLKTQLINTLATAVPVRRYSDYIRGTTDIKAGPRGFELVVVLDEVESYLPNTILLAIIKPTGTALCNTEIKKSLEQKQVIVSVGSSCNTASKMASHVLVAMRADTLFKQGTLRISLGDTNTVAEVSKFCKIFIELLIKLKK